MSNEKELLNFDYDGRVYDGEQVYSRLLGHVPDIDVVKVLVQSVQFFKWPRPGRAMSARVTLHNGYTLHAEYVPTRTEAEQPNVWAIYAFKSAMGKFKEIHRYLEITAGNPLNRPSGK